MKGYEIKENEDITPAMEDYLEMIFRLNMEKKETPVRVRTLSEMLHVKPSSVSKMIFQLQSTGYIISEKYSSISLTEKGKEAGLYLLQRHNIIYSFLTLLNSSEDVLKEAERMEHFIDRRTVENLDQLTCFMKKFNWNEFLLKDD